MDARLLETSRSAEFTLPGLCERVRDVLSRLPRASADERVTLFPDERTLRYYRSLGLLDPPLRQNGREGVYGFRHLLQACAVKVLQADGLTLAQVRRQLAGASTLSIESIVEGASVEGPRRSLLTRELRPGVVVTVDPARVPDPEQLLARIAQAV